MCNKVKVQDAHSAAMPVPTLMRHYNYMPWLQFCNAKMKPPSECWIAGSEVYFISFIQCPLSEVVVLYMMSLVTASETLRADSAGAQRLGTAADREE